MSAATTAPTVRYGKVGDATVPTKTPRKRRLPPDERRAQILEAATRVLARDGIARFSLEGAAREAGIAPTLPRHYFESRDQLLAAVVNQITPQVVEPLLRPDPSLSLEDRYRAYIERVRELPWAHGLWQRAEAVHPDLDEAAGKLRRLFVAASYATPWKDLSSEQQYEGVGWIGFFTMAVTEWLEQGGEDEEALLAVLLDAARRFGVRGA
jgi:AcrR family transcriptional regulator